MVAGIAADWSIGDVSAWLKQHRLNDIEVSFAENGVTGEVLLGLTKEDIRDELRVQNLRDRKLLWELLVSLRKRGDCASAKLAAKMQSADICDLMKESLVERGVKHIIEGMREQLQKDDLFEPREGDVNQPDVLKQPEKYADFDVDTRHRISERSHCCRKP
jgi:hypothetical protein